MAKQNKRDEPARDETSEPLPPPPPQDGTSGDQGSQKFNEHVTTSAEATVQATDEVVQVTVHHVVPVDPTAAVTTDDRAGSVVGAAGDQQGPAATHASLVSLDLGVPTPGADWFRVQEMRARREMFLDYGLQAQEWWIRVRFLEDAGGDRGARVIVETASLGEDGTATRRTVSGVPPGTPPLNGCVLSYYGLPWELAPQLHHAEGMQLRQLAAPGLPFALVFLRGTVHYDDRPLCVDWRHHPDGPDTECLAGLENDPPGKERNRVLRGRKLLYGMARRTNPKQDGAGVEPVEDFLARLSWAMDAVARKRQRLTVGNVAKVYGLARQTFYERLHDYAEQGHQGMTFPELRARMAGGLKPDKGRQSSQAD